MKTKRIKELYKLIESPFILDVDMTYPVIEGNESNFLEYYDLHAAEFDTYFLKEYGSRIVDFDSDTDADIVNEWKDMLTGIQRIYLDSWARLWYALNIDFNPIYNVEEHTITTYGEHETTVSYGEKEKTLDYAQKQNTTGSQEDVSTTYSVAYDSAIEKETGKINNNSGQRIDTEGGHIDTITDAEAEDITTSNEHVDKVDRAGNIGVVSATQLLAEEIKLRKAYSFFKNVFQIVIEEIGAYWPDPDCWR